MTHIFLEITDCTLCYIFDYKPFYNDFSLVKLLKKNIKKSMEQMDNAENVYQRDCK